MKTFIALLSFLLYFTLNGKCDHLTTDSGRYVITSAHPLEQRADYAALADKLKEYDTGCSDNNCTGYEAEWRVIRHQLYLTGIHSCPCAGKKKAVDLEKLFPSECHGGKVKADWFNGELWVALGQPFYTRDNVDFYKKQKAFNVAGARVKSQKDYDYSDAFASDYLKNDDLITKFVYSKINWKLFPPTLDKKVVLSFNVGGGEYPDQIKVLSAPADSVYNNEAISVLKKMQWGVFYVNGKHVPVTLTLPVLFNKDMRETYEYH